MARSKATILARPDMDNVGRAGNGRLLLRCFKADESDRPVHVVIPAENAVWYGNKVLSLAKIAAGPVGGAGTAPKLLSEWEAGILDRMLALYTETITAGDGRPSEKAVALSEAHRLVTRIKNA